MTHMILMLFFNDVEIVDMEKKSFKNLIMKK